MSEPDQDTFFQQRFAQNDRLLKQQRAPHLPPDLERTEVAGDRMDPNAWLTGGVPKVELSERQEARRVNEIRRMCKLHGLDHCADKWIVERLSVETVAAKILKIYDVYL